MPAGDVYELAVDQTIAGQAITNVYHFKQVGGDGTGDGRNAVDAMWDAVYKATYLAILTDQVTINQYRTRRIHPTTTQTITTATTGDGDVAEEGLPTQSCAILRCSAIPLGRKGTGHVKLAGIPISAVTEGRLDSAIQALIRAFGEFMEANQTDAGSGFVFRQVVWSIVDSIAREIVSARTTSRIKTVHSRQIGVGD